MAVMQVGEGFVAVAGGAALMYGIYWLIRLGRPFVETDRIASALKCSHKKARTIKQYLFTQRIPWLTFHRWYCGALNVYMPMFLFNEGDGKMRLISTWDETTAAVLSLCERQKLNPKWSVDDAIGKIGEEIMRLRGARGWNPLDSSRWNEEQMKRRADAELNEMERRGY